MYWTLSALCFGLSLVLGRIVIPPLIRFSTRHDLRDHPGQHKRHSRPVPVLGGAGLFLSLWITVGAASLLFPSIGSVVSSSLVYIFLGALIIFMTGLSDDLRPLSAWTKLFSQVAAGLVLYMGGLSIDPISVPFYGPVEIGYLSVLITVLWVVGLSNAINLIDGLDGLAAGVSLVGVLSLSAIGWLLNVPEVILFAAALAGYLAVFLFYNRFPARIFLGDSGSLQIGFYFAVNPYRFLQYY